MPKLGEMDLPKGRNKGGPGMYYCIICNQYVPEKIKHDKKHHKK